ncbi:hypothetical protein PF0777 [Pyrococcus furiosus DSM 3638]|uniref:Polysaccharide biosynthesis protein C-terminal domain-containing protein n=1 Tax=Pyrococcus furiosus (strain ATCC 43587 / DSM 3638 / JCM 8422 / Vc1) TaxID=186497 RepID=Q8U2Q5_PYRFU|nr:hypothetical protein PF0777 [Pyrococcus furiosus DSM 3638]
MIARYFSTSEYGVFNLALTVLSIAPRSCHARLSELPPKGGCFLHGAGAVEVGNLILTALVIVTVNSLLITVLLILGSGFVAQVFREERLAYALKIVALALPFSALTGVMISISRGFGRVRGQVYFQNIVYPTLFMAFVVVGAFLKLPFAFVFGAYVAAWVLKLLVLTFDMWKNRILGFTTSSNSSTAFLSPLKYSINMPLSINSLVINLSLQFFC